MNKRIDCLRWAVVYEDGSFAVHETHELAKGDQRITNEGGMFKARVARVRITEAENGAAKKNPPARRGAR